MHTFQTFYVLQVYYALIFSCMWEIIRPCLKVEINTQHSYNVTKIVWLFLVAIA